MNTFDIPRPDARILKTIEAAGFEAFLVGGCVRDLLLLRVPSDWDIASSATPHDIMRIFEKTVPTGVKYGTVTVFCGDGKAEVTSYRSEAGYGDCRRPSQVIFCGNIETDLSRRDFTVNAMAFNPSRGLVDPFGGRDDLERRLIRAVGDPAARFSEDALRILRAYRFAAQLNFEIETETYNAACKMSGLVAKISVERVKAELDRILLSERPQLSITLLQDGALSFIAANKKEKSVEALCGFALTPETLPARWAAFFYIAKLDEPCVLMEKLRFDTRTKNETLRFLSELSLDLPENAAQIKKRLSAGFTPEQYEIYLKLRSALTGRDLSFAIIELRRIVKRGEPYSLRMLAVSGVDLLRLGAPPGQQYGKILAALLDKVIEDPLKNDKKTLLLLAEKALHVN